MFPDLLQLSGDTGARELLEKIESTILQIDVNDEGIFFNVNRPADL
jgi:CTP:molybdopterin cytidylyltransferase MocA